MVLPLALIIIVIAIWGIVINSIKLSKEEALARKDAHTKETAKRMYMLLSFVTKYDWDRLIYIHKEADYFGVRNSNTMPNEMGMFNCVNIQLMTKNDIFIEMYKECRSLAEWLRKDLSVKELDYIWNQYYNTLYNNYKQISLYGIN